MENIYGEWVALRASLGKRKSKFTQKRKDIITQVLQSFKSDELILLLQYLRLSEDHYARYIRGENDNNKDYTSFESIFRPTKLQDKIDKAHSWDSSRSNYTDETFFPFVIV